MLLLGIFGGSDLGIEVRNDVFALTLIELVHAPKLAVDLDQQRVTSTQHVLDDARRANALGRILRIER